MRSLVNKKYDLKYLRTWS